MLVHSNGSDGANKLTDQNVQIIEYGILFVREKRERERMLARDTHEAMHRNQALSDRHANVIVVEVIPNIESLKRCLVAPVLPLLCSVRFVFDIVIVFDSLMHNFLSLSFVMHAKHHSIK